MTSVAFCTIAADQDHLVEVPLQQAQVPFTLDQEEGTTVVLVSQDDIDRARAALAKFGTFEGGCS